MVGTVTLIVEPGLIVIDRYLALVEWTKWTGPMEGIVRVVGGLTFHLCFGMGVVYTSQSASSSSLESLDLDLLYLSPKMGKQASFGSYLKSTK
ncbi:MAG: hypothetical protein ACYSU3_19155 [Planctomycetota bacterium]